MYNARNHNIPLIIFWHYWCCCWSLIKLPAAAWASSLDSNIFSDSYLQTREDQYGVGSSSSSIASPSSSFSGSSSSCFEDLEVLIENEDIRTELSTIDLYYLEHGSIHKACQQKTGTASDCRLDFTLYPNNLHEACEKHGGRYTEREHSISCRSADGGTGDEVVELYYQFDHFPSCFASSCGEVEVNKMVSTQVDTVRRSMEKDSGMHCLVDWEILESANNNVVGVVESEGRRQFGGDRVSSRSYSTTGMMVLGVLLVYWF